MDLNDNCEIFHTQKNIAKDISDSTPPLLFNLNLIFGVLLKYKNQMEALIFFSSFRFTHPYGININLLGKALTDARAR